MKSSYVWILVNTIFFLAFFSAYLSWFLFSLQISKGSEFKNDAQNAYNAMIVTMVFFGLLCACGLGFIVYWFVQCGIATGKLNILTRTCKQFADGWLLFIVLGGVFSGSFLIDSMVAGDKSKSTLRDHAENFSTTDFFGQPRTRSGFIIGMSGCLFLIGYNVAAVYYKVKLDNLKAYARGLYAKYMKLKNDSSSSFDLGLGTDTGLGTGTDLDTGDLGDLGL